MMTNWRNNRHLSVPFGAGRSRSPLCFGALALYRPSMKTRGEQLLSTSDAAKILNVSPDMVRYLERRGKLPAQYTLAGTRIFRLEDVERLARERSALEPPSDAA